MLIHSVIKIWWFSTQDILVSFYHIINHVTTQWLETISIYYCSKSAGHSGSPAGLGRALLCSLNLLIYLWLDGNLFESYLIRDGLTHRSGGWLAILLAGLMRVTEQHVSCHPVGQFVLALMETAEETETRPLGPREHHFSCVLWLTPVTGHPRLKGWGNRFYLLMGEAAKSHSIECGSANGGNFGPFL